MKIAGSGVIALLAICVLGLVRVAHAADAPPIVIHVDSPAVVFSPGNWTGDDSREGKIFRQTWNPGAYFRVAWESKNSKPAATLLLDTSTYPPGFTPPLIAYSIDGIWKSQIRCANEIKVEGIPELPKHELSVYLIASEQKERWGSEGKSPVNVLRFTGLQVDAGSKPLPIAKAPKWALIVGDSITEGVIASELAAYSTLVGQALQTQGYEYGISACGWSGWINKGDNPPGDVPGYYTITNAQNGAGGMYDDLASRWNKIDGNHHSLLDSQGHLSAYGKTGQEPSLIMVNYGTNDAIWRANHDDAQASIIQGLAALRKSAPQAQIIVIIPFSQCYTNELLNGVAAHKKAHPTDARISVIDLGPDVERTLSAPNHFMGDLHPNDKGHALFAARIIPQVMRILDSEPSQAGRPARP